jgi:hypothetical protein
MKYALLVYGDENAWATTPQEEMDAVYAAHGAYTEALIEAGVLRGGEELQPTTTATSVRFGGAAPATTDGPFAETREQLGGFYLIEVETLDEALEWARKMPAMTDGTVEVRPCGMSGSAM